MSQKYVDIVRAVYERYREGDFTSSADLLDHRAVLVLEDVGDWGAGGSGAFFGAEEISTYTRELVKPWRRITMEAEEIIAAGDSVLVRVRQSGVGGTSGAPVELRYFTLWSFRGPKVIRIESFRDHAEALKAAGLTK